MFWLEGMEPQPIICWYTFCKLWSDEFKTLHIHANSNDMCGECYIFRNKFRFKQNSENDSGESKCDDDDAELDDVEEEDPHNSKDENLVKQAIKHVSQAQAQWELANECIM